jgi:hypothetical protein
MFGGFHYAVVSIIFFPPTPLQTVPLSHSCLIIIIITIIILGIGSTNEQEYTLFGILSLAYLTQQDYFQFHLFSSK